MSGQEQELHRFELEPDVCDWLEDLSDSGYKRVDEVAGLLAEKGASLGRPWPVVGAPQWPGTGAAAPACPVTVTVTYWCPPDRTIVLLTVFRKTRQQHQRQIHRAVRAQQVCERDHPRPADQVYERQSR